jgi:hypothetical protein
MKYLLKSTSALLLALAITLPSFGAANAQGEQGRDTDNVAGLVTCGKADSPEECGFADLIATIEKVIDFTIFNIIIPVVVLVILYYGVMIIISGDKPAKLTELKKALWKVVVGLFFIICAWVIVEAVVDIFGVELQEAGDGTVDKPIKLLDF